MTVFEDYPKALYRIGFGPGPTTWGERVDMQLVASATQEARARRRGWTGAVTATEQAKHVRRIRNACSRLFNKAPGALLIAAGAIELWKALTK